MVPSITKRIPRRVVIFVAFMLNSLGLMLTGPSYLLFGDDSPHYFWLLFPGFLLNGVAIAFIFVPILPEILSTIE